jgi:nucleotide-binding universal stress UspA family protein
MAEWKKICCAIDFSGPSRFALEKAADLTKRLQSDLTLLHVNEAAAVVGSDETGVSAPTLLEEAAREIRPKMEAWHRQAEQLVGRPVRTNVVAGSAADEILRFLREGSFDLLVMGTHGRTGLAHFVVGSVAEQVQRHAEIPVLVVRGS